MHHTWTQMPGFINCLEKSLTWNDTLIDKALNTSKNRLLDCRSSQWLFPAPFARKSSTVNLTNRGLNKHEDNNTWTETDRPK